MESFLHPGVVAANGPDNPFTAPMMTSSVPILRNLFSRRHTGMQVLPGMGLWPQELHRLALQATYRQIHRDFCRVLVCMKS